MKHTRKTKHTRKMKHMRKMKHKYVMVGGDKYQCEKTLGQGAYGFVVLCDAKDNSQKVAVKFLKPSPSLTSMSDFLSEIEILSQLNHPNIIKQITLDDKDLEISDKLKPYLYFNKKYMLGLELCSYDLVVFLKQNHPNKSNEDAFSQLFEGIKHLHEHQIVCGDIKPANILVKIDEATNTITYKLSDFGSARERKSMDDEDMLKHGTPYYIPWHLPYTTYFRDIYAYFCTCYFIYKNGLIYNSNGGRNKTIEALKQNVLRTDATIFSEFETMLPIFQQISVLEKNLLDKKFYITADNLDFEFDKFYIDFYNGSEIRDIADPESEETETSQPNTNLS